ncbi:MAG: hypothetical protein UY48_C0003G0067 [Candidatus Gottesmanbacteria bacterium GW2011_GWB1_49_7]|uniref:Uncharacterized protein n=1 Tax=Candidatus Gottesmanbacteria bacterium GW2011_GWB1_49_7 TaxID=1618448 RepID=A0A0G1W3V0_9BACT|nr:MAG: hypothetical protein UY48_C0003G0067 [Candidatus Gottesmanbacteria bacterium GW2011_GWB1_49_7]
MKKYTLSLAASFTHQPEHPERTATKSLPLSSSMDVVYQVWPNRKSMAKTIRMQQQREPRGGDWYSVVSLSDGEGY